MKHYRRASSSTSPGGKRGVHVLVAERALGKRLPSGAEVHHVNSDPQDNRRNNLVICQNHHYHMLLHARQRILERGGNPDRDKECARCGRMRPKTEFSPRRDHGNPTLFHACRPCAVDIQRERRLMRRLGLTKLDLILQAIKDPERIGLLKPNQQALDRLARQWKGALDIPGVKPVCQKVAAAGSR